MAENIIFKKKWPVAVAVLALAALACSIGGGGGGEVAGVTTGTRITVSNAGSSDICYVYISPGSENAWGSDLLASATIKPGAGHGFSVDADVAYDLRADDCDDRNAAEQRGVTVGKDQDFRWSVAAGDRGAAQVTMTNKGSTPVCFVNFSLSSEDSWGPDRLATESIVESGGSVTFNLAAAGEHDLRALDCDRNTLSELHNEQVNSGDDLTWDVGP